MPIDPGKKSDGEKQADPRGEEASPHDKEIVKPAADKVPEPPGNLRRRAEWFQKRSGRKD